MSIHRQDAADAPLNSTSRLHDHEPDVMPARLVSASNATVTKLPELPNCAKDSFGTDGICPAARTMTDVDTFWVNSHPFVPLTVNWMVYVAAVNPRYVR